MKHLKILLMPITALSVLPSCNNSKVFIPVKMPKVDLFKVEYDWIGDTKEESELHFFTYNKKNLIETTKFIWPGAGEGDYQINTYTYDNHENIITHTFAAYDDGEIFDSSTDTFERKYKNKNRETYAYHEETILDASPLKEELTTTYDDKNYVIVEKRKFLEKGPHSSENDYTDTYQYDKNGYLLKLRHIDDEEHYNSYETEFVLDEHHCATTYTIYSLKEDGTRGGKLEEATSTFYKNLWYRPERVVTTDYFSNEVITTIYEYENANKVTLMKGFNGTEEPENPTPTSYEYYHTYEY